MTPWKHLLKLALTTRASTDITPRGKSLGAAEGPYGYKKTFDRYVK